MQTLLVSTCLFALLGVKYCVSLYLQKHNILDDCIRKITYENLKYDTTEYMSENEELLKYVPHSDGLTKIAVKSGNKFIVLQSTKCSTNYAMLVETLDKLTFFEELNRKSRYIIICNSTANVSDIRRTFTKWFNVGVMDVIIVSKGEQAANVFYWNPYSTDSKCGQVVVLEKVTCTNLNSNNFTIIKNQPRTNLNNCHLSIVQIDGPPFVMFPEDHNSYGIFHYFFNTIETLSGIRVHYDRKASLEEEYYCSGTYDNLITYLDDGKADVGIGKLFINTTVAPVEFGPAFYSDELLFLSRRRRKLQSHKKLTDIFTSSCWVLFFITFATISALVTVMQKRKSTDYIRINLELYRTVLGMANTLNFNGISLRIVFIFYSLYCINLDAIYIGRLSSALTTPDLEDEIDHIDVLIKLGIPITIPYITDLLGQISYYASMNVSLSKGLSVSNRTEYELLRRVALTQENGTVVFGSLVETFPYESSLVDYFHWRFLLTLFPVYYLRKSNPLNDVINFWSQEMIEKGFIKKWWVDIVRRQNKSVIDLEESSTRNVVLTVKHLEHMFFLLLLGWSAAFAVFLIEIIVKKYFGKLYR